MIAKMIELKNTFELCDIWRLRNPKNKRFTFQQNHMTGFIQFRSDFFLLQIFCKSLFTKQMSYLRCAVTTHVFYFP